MITLREAFNLCGIADNEVVWLSDREDGANMWKYPMIGEEVRRKLDMRRTKVIRIKPMFCFEDYGGIQFIIKKEVR